MKKNKMMRTASVLLVLTLLTVCVISGTFAKYVTSGEGSDSARVAKFGVTVTANGETFANSYAKTDDSFTLDTNTVVSTADVVAPGTNGNMASMALSGTPEVAVRVTYAGHFTLDENWKDENGDYYCPLEIKVNNDTIKGNDFESASAFAAAVNAKIDAYSKDYKAGTNLGPQGNDSLKVSWSWPFAGDDTKDTALGNATTPGNVTLDVTTTVTQID